MLEIADKHANCRQSNYINPTCVCLVEVDV